jgi:hypothetical protein
LGSKITKIWELKLHKSGNKNYKNLRTKLQNLGTKITKIQEQKLEFFDNPGTKNLGTIF